MRESVIDFIKKYKLQFICVIGGFALFAIVQAVNPGKADEVLSIDRAGYGSRKTQQLYVEGLESAPVLVDVPIEARKFTDEEIDDAMLNCVQEAIAKALGDNPSLEEVCYDLELPAAMSEYGFKLIWTPQNYDVLLSSGEVKNEELTEPVETSFDVEVSDGVRTKYYTVPVTVMPQRLTAEEARMKGLMSEITEADKNASTEKTVVLPTEANGNRIRFRDGEDMSYDFIWILGIVFAVLLMLRDKENTKKDDEKRLKQMQMDYPEIVSKLLVFVGAGMSVRLAWDAIAQDYEKSWAKIEGTSKVRYAYEELCRTNARIKTGASEGIAYREFGRECKSKQYMKLASLLEQNRKSGVANMRALLETEMIEAWAERKNLALRQGEEASTKLMIPLFMMLGIVMVIIMVPAMMSF